MTDHATLIARLRAHADADDGGLLVDDLHEAADAFEALVWERDFLQQKLVTQVQSTTELMRERDAFRDAALEEAVASDLSADALARREGADELEGAMNYAQDIERELNAANKLLAEAADALEAAEREKDELKRALAVEGRQAASADRMLIGLKEQRDELLRERNEARRELTEARRVRLGK